MLERAAGCLENAGRRFFRDSNGAIRHSRSIYPTFGQHHGSSNEFPHWLFAFVLASDQRASHAPSAPPNTGRTANDARAPFLDFLYPPRIKGFTTSSLSHSPKRLASRRRRKAAPGLPRTYASKASPQQRSQADEEGGDNDGISEGIERKRAKEGLVAMLSQTEPVDYDKAWMLYTVAGQPSELNSALLALMSRSERHLDFKRSKGVFYDIPAPYRSADDYLHLVQSYMTFASLFDTDTLPYVSDICQKAASNGVGGPCLAFATATSVNNAQWEFVGKMWNLRPKSPEDEGPAEGQWLQSLFSQIDLSFFLKTAINLENFLSDVSPASELVSILIRRAFSSLEVIESLSTKSILLFLRKCRYLRILTADHFIKLIETCRSSEFRATFTRSIIFYRHFRWQMPEEVPPAKLIGAMIRSLTDHEITNGVLYFLEEFSHFHGKPTIDAYKKALIAFSRIGDAPKVNELFESLVSDHGKPRSRRLLSPLLYVHARVGNVPETRRQLERIPQEFGLVLNTVCWNILLTAHANANDLNGCLESFQQMLRSKVELNAHTFGIIMGLCANRGDIDNVRRLLAMAKERQMEITAPLVDTIVESHCRNGQFDMAESVAQTSLGLDVKGSQIRMWNMLLWHYAFRIDLESISRVRTFMKEARLQPDGMTYAAMMLSLVLIWKTDSARRIFRTLHRNRRVHATEFHYTIILYGYVRERNRDMVHVIFREIKDRFQRPGSSSSLLFLKSQLQRDLQLVATGEKPMESANMRLGNAEKFLAEVIADFDTTKLATKEPMPATGRQSAMEAFPGMFYEYVMNAYGTRGASAKVRELFDLFIARQQPLSDTDNAHEIAPLRLLNTLMLTHLRADEYEGVEECWQMAFPRAIKLATPLNLDDWLANVSPPADSLDPPRPSLPQPAHDAFVASGILDQAESPTSEKPLVHPSCRFLLSRALSLYMRSLAYRNEIGKIPQLVAEVERVGFGLTTFNWSTYVQMLASSDKPSDQLQAFTVFEKKFMPNFPGWERLRQGLGARPAEVPATISAIEMRKYDRVRKFLGTRGRKYWSKIQPDFMQPTYISMVYLASALNSFRERSILKGAAELVTVFSAAPKTIEALGNMPYLRDKFQGVLLRSRQQKGGTTQPPGEIDLYVWTGGVLGVGGRHRAPLEVLADDKNVRAAEGDLVLDQVSVDTASQAARGLSDEVEDPLPQKTLNPEDEHDIETETNLQEAQGHHNPDDESQRPRKPDNTDDPSVTEPASEPMIEQPNEAENASQSDAGGSFEIFDEVTENVEEAPEAARKEDLGGTRDEKTDEPDEPKS